MQDTRRTRYLEFFINTNQHCILRARGPAYVSLSAYVWCRVETCVLGRDVGCESYLKDVSSYFMRLFRLLYDQQQDVQLASILPR
jgi:hypothetical protein